MTRSRTRLLTLAPALAVAAALVAPTPALSSTTSVDAGAVTASVDTQAAYYASAEGLSRLALKDELHEIVDDHTMIGYDDVWDALKTTDEAPGDPGSVDLLYGGTKDKDDNGGGVDDWNREHVWAKSHGDFGTSTGPGTDIHHLRPTDVTVNSDRGNLDFDEGGTENDEAPGNFSDSDSWEPLDEDKGDVARMIMYMDVRYEGDDGFPDLEVNDAVSNGSAPLHGRISVLLDWHAQDPPSAAERARNDAIEQIQGNRNPFIDNPEYASAIWG